MLFSFLYTSSIVKSMYRIAAGGYSLQFLQDQFMNVWNYVTGPALWLAIGTAFLQTVSIIILAMLVIRFGNKMVERIFESRTRRPFRITERREVTLKKLIQNVLKYTVYFIAIITILDDVFGQDIKALLAGAGVAGLAIGFGAQNLVRDVISGFFIIFEDQFSVGDYISVSGVEGTVEEIGLRTSKI